VQQAPTPQHIFDKNHGDPTVRCLQRIYCPTALFGLTTKFAVTISFMQESASAGFQVMFSVDVD
jgi:hypothetical protein